jgi:hypothetical protein
MRRDGRNAPGSCGAVFTGHAVFLRPAFTAATSARLSFLVRPLMVGTITGGSFGAESVAVLEAVEDPAVAAGAVDDAAAMGAASATSVTSGGTSPAGVGPASLLAAQAIETAKMTAFRDRYLMSKVSILLMSVTMVGNEARRS